MDARDGMPHPAKPSRVLVVDDNDAVLRSTARLLQMIGYEVVQAADAVQALEVVSASGSVDLMLTDLIMPGRNGVELSLLVRALRPGLPIVMMTGFFDGPMPTGGWVVLQKPFNRKQLVAAIAAARGLGGSGPAVC